MLIGYEGNIFVNLTQSCIDYVKRCGWINYTRFFFFLGLQLKVCFWFTAQRNITFSSIIEFVLSLVKVSFYLTASFLLQQQRIKLGLQF